MCKRKQQGTVPETSAKVYGAWRIPAYSAICNSAMCGPTQCEQGIAKMSIKALK